MSRDAMLIAFPILHHDLIRLLPIFDPLPSWGFHLLARCMVSCPSMTRTGLYLMSSRSQHVWQYSLSQPYIVCIFLLCTFPTTRNMCPKLVTKSPRVTVVMWAPCVHPSVGTFPHQNHKPLASQLVIATLTLPMGSRRLRFFSLFANSLLLLASIEFVAEDYLYDAPDAMFTRLGAIYPDRVKLAIRYPHHRDPIHVVWRKVRESLDLQAQPWTLGPPIMFSKTTDWVNSTTIPSLWPNTIYECNPLAPFVSMVWFLCSTRFAGDLG